MNKPLRLLQSLLLNLAFLAGSLLFADQKYEISDDFIIDNVLAGALGRACASRAPYINRLLGEFLAFLYRATEDVSIFFIFQLIVSLLSFTTVTYILLTRTKTAVGLSLSAVLLLFFTDDYYILICCTRTAALAAVSGGALFLHALNSENEHPSPLELLSGGLLLLLGSLIRFKSALLVLPFLLVLYFWGRFLGGRRILGDGSWEAAESSGTVPGRPPAAAGGNRPCSSWEPSLQQLGTVPVLWLLLPLTLHLAGSLLSASDPAYAAYKTYDDRRSAVVDTASFGYASMKDTMDSLGLSEADYYMLRSWNFNDREIFTDEILDTIAAAQDRIRYENTLNPHYLLTSILKKHYHAYACMPGLALLAAFYIYARKHIPYMAVTLLIGAALILAFEIIGRPVYRVTSAVLTAEAVALAAGPCLARPEKKREPLRIRASVLALILLLLLTRQVLRPQDSYWMTASDEDYRFWTEMTFNDSDAFVAEKYTFDISHRGPEQGLIAAIEADTDHYYFLDFTSTIQRIFYNYPHMKRLPVDYYTDNYSYLGGVLTNFPSVNEDLLRHHLDPDSLIRSVVNDSVLVVDNNLYEIRLLYLREHYFPNARMDLVAEVDGFKIWRYYAE